MDLSHFSSRRGHISGENDDAALDRFFFENSKHSGIPSQKKKNMVNVRHKNTNFRMVLTPTLFSSEKKIKI